MKKSLGRSALSTQTNTNQKSINDAECHKPLCAGAIKIAPREGCDRGLSLTWIGDSVERHPSKAEVDGHTSATAGESLWPRGTGT